jgi:putative glycosyltransferase (TIGR04372 family)
VENNLPKLTLPDELNDRVNNALQRARGERDAKLCNFYLRYEYSPPGNTRWQRNASPIEVYLPAIRILVDAGYQVLMTGDRDLSLEPAREFAGMLVDTALLGIEEDVFNMFAGTAVDIVVNNHGGGSHLLAANKIPMLVIDAFPFWFGFRNSWMYFKTLLDDQGQPVPVEDLFSKYLFISKVKEGHLLANSAQEVADAVTRFLKDLKTPQAFDPCEKISELIPPNTPFIWSKARFSPAWGQRYAPHLVIEENPQQLRSALINL